MTLLKDIKYPEDFIEQAANIEWLSLYFKKALKSPGDIAEFGCFEGGLSMKMAYLVKKLKIDRTVYALDTFEGFSEADPHPQGAITVGAYTPRFDAYNFLLNKSKEYPLVLIKGDVRETISQIKDKFFSFVWLDLDLQDSTYKMLDFLKDRVYKTSIVGVDDYGRESCPGIVEAVDYWVGTGVWDVIGVYKDYHQIFLVKGE